MTAKERNWNISRLRGIKNFANLVPDDVYCHMMSNKEDIQYMIDDLFTALDMVRINRYTCKNCMNVSTLKRTRATRAYKCDICGQHHEDLYAIKQPKKDK